MISSLLSLKERVTFTYCDRKAGDVKKVMSLAVGEFLFIEK
jgi:hypothetical protein